MAEALKYPGNLTRDQWDKAVLDASDLILDTFKENNISPAVASVAMQKTQASMVFIMSNTFQDAVKGIEAHEHSCIQDIQTLYSQFGEEKLNGGVESLMKALKEKADELAEELVEKS